MFCNMENRNQSKQRSLWLATRGLVTAANSRLRQGDLSLLTLLDLCQRLLDSAMGFVLEFWISNQPLV